MSFSSPAIVIKNLGKKYKIYRHPIDRLKHLLFPNSTCFHRDFWALRSINFSIDRGKTVGIIGVNGSGKSTLLQLIYGTTEPTEGTIETTGKIVALLELGAGFNPEFTGRENVVLNATLLGYTPEKIREKMESIISFSELEQFIDQPVKTYSSGMFARLAFSVAIHVEPEILFIDETLSVGDARFISKCMRRINELRSSGVTILFVSHDIGAVRALCEQVIWIDKGSLIANGDVLEITARYTERLLGPERSGPAEPEESLIDKGKAPIIHWGSHLGLIKDAYICNENGQKKPEFYHGEIIQINLHLTLPIELNRESLWFSFSIKDLKGTDLIVESVQYRDLRPTTQNGDEKIIIDYCFKNILNEGKYLLVCAVEDRLTGTAQYYEYIEGVQYFASVLKAKRKYYGIVHPDIIVNIRTLND